MAVEPGQYRTRLTLQAPVQVRDAHNNVLPQQWAFVRTLSCRILPVTIPKNDFKRIEGGREFAFAASQMATATHLIFVRAQSFVITPNMRLVSTLTGQAFNITEAILIEMVRKTVRIFAKENVGSTGSVVAPFNAVIDNNGQFVFDTNGNFVVTAS